MDKESLDELASSNDPLSDLAPLLPSTEQGTGKPNETEKKRKGLVHRTVSVNPFSYDSPPDQWELFKLVFFTVSLLAFVRLFLVLLLLGLAFLVTFVATLGLNLEDWTKEPMSRPRRWLLRPVGWLCRAILFVMGFYHIEVEGVPSKDAAFIVANHCSIFDAVVIYWLTRPSAVAKAEVFDVPVLGRILKSLQVIPVKRESEQAREETKRTIERFSESRLKKDGPKFPPVLIFPQGTTTRNEVLTMFQRGAFLPGLPVQPVVLDYRKNTHFNPAWVVTRRKDYWARRHFTQFVMHLRVVFLPVHFPSEAEKADATLFANNVREEIATVLETTVKTEHSFEDAKLYKKALDLKEKKHVLRLLETPKENDRVRMANFQLKEVKDIFGHSRNYGLNEVQEAYKLFQQMDTNGDGTIDFEEFCQALGLNSDHEEARMIFSFFDRDHEGSVDFRELVISMAICCPDASYSMDERAKFAFSLYDKNHDERISESELRNLLMYTRGGSFKGDSSLEEKIETFVKSAVEKGASKDENGEVSIPWEIFRQLIEDDATLVQCAISTFETDAFPMSLDKLAKKKEQ